MKHITSFTLITLILLASVPAAFSQQTSASGASDPRRVEQLKTASRAPVINGEWATFVYRGDGRDVELVGEMTDWERRGLKLQPLAGTNVKFISFKFSADARIEYKLIVDDKWILDPLNPDKKDNGVGGENNFLLMPRYQPSRDARERAGVRHGRIVPLDLPADAQGRKRAARVYLPPGYDASSERYPVIYFGDGIEYIERAKANVIVDNLLADGRLRPLVMVFLAPIERMKEYWLNKDYLDWLVQQLVPMIDATYRTKAAPDARAIAGASLGGLTSVYAAFTHPEIFGLVFGQSSALQVNKEQLISDIESAERKPIKLYLEVGRYESLLDSNRRLKAVLEAKGYKLSYKEVSFGHNWTHWSDELVNGLSYLFPAN